MLFFAMTGPPTFQGWGGGVCEPPNMSGVKLFLAMTGAPNMSGGIGGACGPPNIFGLDALYCFPHRYYCPYEECVAFFAQPYS